jgi:PAS domain S-box-containing protein
MKLPKINRAVFQSRIGKRIFWMFIGCSFVPIVILSVLSYTHIQNQLKDQTVVRLHQLTKSIGMSVYERLELLESELRLLSPNLLAENGTALGRIVLERADNSTHRFQGFTLIADDDRQVPLEGRLETVPSLTLEEKRQLHTGRSVIRVISQETGIPRIQLGLRTVIGSGTPGILIGEVDTTYLWGIGQQYNLPPATELTIIDHRGNVLISSLADITELAHKSASVERDRTTHHFAWQNDEEIYLACYWDLFLKSHFEAGHWTIVLSQARDDALAIIRDFKYDFPLTLLFAFWVILLVSIRFIRKSLIPLKTLQEGTRRIHDGDFSQTVEVESRDEFEDLAESFNLMMHRLAQIFGELSVMAEMGQYGTTRPEVADLVRVELQLMAAKLNFDWGLVMIEGQAIGGGDVVAGYGISPQLPPKSLEVIVPEDNPALGQLMTAAIAHRTPIFSNDTRELAAILPATSMTFLGALNCQALLCVPMMFETRHMGVFAVGKTGNKEPLRDNDKDLLVGIASQTTVAVNSIVSFRRLEESEARFRQAFDHAATGITLVHRDFKILASNRYLQDLLGYTETQLAGKGLDDITVPEDRAVGRKILQQMLEGELTSAQYENRYQCKSGDAVWVRINASLMRDNHSAPLQFIFHIQDLTTEKAQEKKRHRLENQLRQAQKMEAMGTLAGGIAHDFNNILSAISGFTELTLLNLPDDAAIRENLTNVKSAAGRATDLVRQILAFSRQSENEKLPIQISSVVKEALQLLRASMPSSIEIRKAIDNTPLPVMADPTQIHQIVMNLCTNALHAMESSGGTLDVSLKQVELPSENHRPPKALPPGRYVMLTVADDGCGMDPQTMHRIFDPYFTTKTKGKGTGLGLAVVHGIVENHDGAIGVSSSPGQGTHFTIFFPVAAESSYDQAKPKVSNPCGTERILFIDDEPMLVDIGKSMLAKLGYHVTGLTDPNAALARFQQDPSQFDMVITDLTMPGITGDRLAEKLACLRPDIPILLCSGYAKHIDGHTALAGNIAKPITLENLANAVRQAFDR